MITAAERVAKLAREHGWDVEIIESHGEVAGRPVHQTTLRLRRESARAAACWCNGAFRAAFVMGRLDKTPFPWRVGATRLREVIAGIEEGAP